MSVGELIQAPTERNAEPAAGSAMPVRTRVAVIGAGISGLALAVGLKRAGVSFVLLEKSARPGGVIGSVEEAGFTFERGPNTILDKSPAVDELIEAVGLSAAAQRAPVRGQSRHIWHNGRLHEVPSGPGAFIRTRLVSWGAKLNLLREMFVPPVKEDESLEQMIRRRLGDEIYERGFVPMVQGIWAGDPSKMSAEASFPLLKKLEREHDSLIRGLEKTMKASARERRASTRPDGPHMVSFAGGLEQLPRAMAEFVREDLRLETAVEQIERIGSAFAIHARDRRGDQTIVADSVVICGEAWNAAQLVESLASGTARALQAVHYAPIIAVGLGVESSSLRLPPGFGFLAARNQGLRVLGGIFNSNFLPGRAPEGCAALTVMIGGDLDPDAMKLNDDEIRDLVRRDLKTALGWNGQARAVRIERWARAIPRYGMDHAALSASLSEAESACPGLRFFGNYHGGVSLSDRIEKAAALAKELASTSSLHGSMTT